jgi:ankyrin repeat domain-containing protein 50
VNYSSYFEKLSNLFMAIGRSAPRYQTIALLYPQSKSLQAHLSEYFIVVVRLCHQLLKFTQKSALRQFTSTLSDSEIKSYQNKLDTWANMIRDDVGVLTAQKVNEEASDINKIKSLWIKDSKSAFLRQRIEKNTQILNSFSTYSHETTWKQTRKAGNATFFRQTPEYRDWKNENNSSTLAYIGKLGAGKSVLLANIVDDLILESPDATVTYFFCRHDIKESLEARTILGSLSRQLLQSNPDLQMAVDYINNGASHQDLDSILDSVCQNLRPNGKSYFVLDGLDDCDPEEVELAIKYLLKLQKVLPLLLCLSLRLDSTTSSQSRLMSEQFLNARTVSITDNNPDIGIFIETELENRLKSESLIIGDPALILEIQDALMAGSQGMFLWVVLQFESICAMRTDKAIRQALSNLPKGLSETFSRILGRSEDKIYQRRILELVTTAKRPLTTEELREALSVIPGDAVWNPSNLLNDVFLTMACCGSLVIVDEEELTVRLVHHSVKQYLMHQLRDHANSEFYFTLDTANTAMANVILTYLNYGVFGTQLSTMVVPQINAGSAPSQIIRSALVSSASSQSIALKLLKSRKLTDFNMGQTLMKARGHDTFRSLNEFHFFNYAESNWLPHVLSVPSLETVMQDLLVSLLFQENAEDADSYSEYLQTLKSVPIERWNGSILIAVSDSKLVSWLTCEVATIERLIHHLYPQQCNSLTLHERDIQILQEKWCLYDSDRTGYISKAMFPALLRDLLSSFDMHIYNSDAVDYKVKNIQLKMIPLTRFKQLGGLGTADGMNYCLRNLPVDQIRSRRQKLQNFYHEVLVSCHADLGIEFKDFLIILVAHYKIDESKASLIPKEDRKRRARLQLVPESIRKERVMNLVERIYWRRYLRKHSWSWRMDPTHREEFRVLEKQQRATFRDTRGRVNSPQNSYSELEVE